MVRVGKVEAGTISDWHPEPGTLVSWQPSRGSLAKAAKAPISPVPPSYMQAHHLRNFRSYRERGLEMSRLLISSWDIPGICDIRTMTHVVNAHMRRHDTFRSWFEHTEGDHFVRRTLERPNDIQFVAVEHGELTTQSQWREHLLATPSPLEWGCVRFSIIQRADHFTFCVAIDHLHCDAMFVGVVFAEIHLMYLALVSGGAPLRLAEPGSYDNYCNRQREHISGLTLDSPVMSKWTEFFDNNDGSLPKFPLPLGDTSAQCEMMGVRLMDERQTLAFEAACMSAGARFCGGVFAISAVVQHELTGADEYYAIVPIDIRRTEEDFMTTGWFTGFVPITVPTVGSSFGEIVKAAQESFDSGRDLAEVPLDCVMELVPWLREGQWGAPLLFYLDAGIPPLSAMANSHVEGLRARLCHDGGMMGQIDIRVNRLEKETQLTVLFPNNPVARESVTRYVEALKSAFVRVAEGRDVMPARSRTGSQLHLAYSRRTYEPPATVSPLTSWRTG
ncbi:SL659 acyltransferase papA1 [Mycobacterium marinum]|uniref:SL659 acyltransferase papA1 n=1 Tax=Mycobacterium marinum TaxID=1781 RepID=A0A2Z5YDZ8_MYCMR|nr:condensation domain-containing protein [Mycobacterium marinum]AXN44290.1 SL659 acyltransferase papA1 [Mycobacterium marinum]AXN49660.1 SL659 acyltransferase papA1 [Mycobacterium marinum]RFZ09840.1 SL659 acyltransferase papA1 [Mycobacterium marinum]RFZ12796.1 SL659 acyltransferase papA1 [Mycobacterium marinum]RFZ17266.1 SL659 acyltransferase papA1 [Mycobacterium marinum]